MQLCDLDNTITQSDRAMLVVINKMLVVPSCLGWLRAPSWRRRLLEVPGLKTDTNQPGQASSPTQSQTGKGLNTLAQPERLADVEVGGMYEEYKDFV